MTANHDVANHHKHSATVTILRDDLEAVIGFLEGFDFDDDPNAELVREYLPRLRASLINEARDVQ